MKQTYQATVNGDVRLTFEADFAQASCPLTIEGSSTPFQVADARHRPARAAEILNNWSRSEGGEAWGEDESVDVAVVE